MVLRLLNRMESAVGDPFVPVHPRWWLLQTLSGFLGVLVKLLVELRQLMKTNGCMVIYCRPASAFCASLSSPGVKQTSACSIHQGVVHNLAALIMCKYFDMEYLIPPSLYYCFVGITCTDAYITQSMVLVQSLPMPQLPTDRASEHYVKFPLIWRHI